MTDLLPPDHDWKRRERVEKLLAPWNAEVIEDPGGGLHLTLSSTSKVDQACTLIPKDDVYAEASFLTCDLSDTGLETYLSVPRYHLHEINLIETLITGAGLKCLRNCPNLDRLKVQFSDSSHEAIVGISSCYNLYELILDTKNVSFVKNLQPLSNLSNLRILEIRAKEIGESLGFIQNLQELNSLWLESTDLSESLLVDAAHAQNLTELSLIGRNLTGAGLTQITSLKKLVCLRLQGTSLGEEGFSRLENLANLDELWLENIQLSGTIAKSLVALNLRSLHLSEGTNVDDDDIIDALFQCSTLEDLWITTEISERRLDRLRKALPNCAL